MEVNRQVFIKMQQFIGGGELKPMNDRLIKCDICCPKVQVHPHILS